MIQNTIVIKDDGTGSLSLLNAAPIYRLSSSKNKLYLYAPYSNTNTVRVAFLLSNGVKVPFRPITQSTDTIADIVPSGSIEEGHLLWEYSIPSAVLNAVAQRDSSQVWLSFKESEIQSDTDYLGIYTTASEDYATVNAALKVEFPTATTGQWANVWQSTSNTFVSWSFDGTDFIKGTEILNEQTVGTTSQVSLSVNPSVDSDDEEIDVTVTDIVFMELADRLTETESDAKYVEQDLSGYTEDTTITADYYIFMNDLAGNPRKVKIGEAVGDVSGAMLKANYTPTADGLGYGNIVDSALQLWNGKADATLAKVIVNQDGSVDVTAPNGFYISEVDYNKGGAGGKNSWSDTEQAIETIINANVTLQNGRELLKLGRNTGASIPDLEPLAVIGSVGQTAEVEPVDITNPTQSFKTIGMATEVIGTNETKNMATVGRVRGDFTGFTEGADLYCAVGGGLTETKPSAPNRCIRMGTLEKTGTSGIFYLNPIILPNFGELSDVEFTSLLANQGIKYDGTKFINGHFFADKSLQWGSFKETFDFKYNATTSVMELTSPDSLTELTEIFDDGETMLSLPVTVAPTFGSDTVPQLNYFYILKSAKTVITKSTTGFPSVPHIKIAVCYFRSEVSTDADGGPLVNQNWNDHAAGTDLMGHILHMAERLRKQGASYFSGLQGLGSKGFVDDVAGTLYLKHASGVAYQLHKQTVSAKDTSVSDDIHIINDPTTPYQEITTLNGFTEDSNGTVIGNNEYFNVVVFTTANKSGEYTPLLLNLPDGIYGASALDDAKADVNATAVYTLPRAFNKEAGVALPLVRITLRNEGGTIKWVAEDDLRDTFNVFGGGGTGGQDTSFPDSIFEITNTTDPTKIIQFSAALLTASTTRTLSAQDKDYTIGDKADIDANSTRLDNLETSQESTQIYTNIIQSTFGTINPIEFGSPLWKELLGLTLNQLVTDGDDFASGWSLTNATGSVTDGVYSFTASVQFGSLTKPVNLVNGKKYYLVAKVKADSTLVNFSISGVGSTYHSGSGNYEYLSTVTTWAAATGSWFVRIRDERASAWTQIDVDEVMVIPIDNTPYSGLTASQINSRISYFEDLTDLVNPSVKSIGKNLFDKTQYTTTSHAYLISVKPSTNYVWSESIEYKLYDSGQNVLSTATASTITTTSTTAYISFANTIASVDTFQLEEGTVATTYSAYKEDTQTLNGTFRSVGSIRDKVRFDVDNYVVDRYVGVITGVGIGATINTTTIPLISLTSKFIAVDETTGDIQEGSYGDVLTLTNTATVRYAYDTPLLSNEIIDSDGGLVQDDPTTIIQENVLASEIDLVFALNNTKQIKTNADVNARQDSELERHEDRLDIVEPKVTQLETDRGVMANLTTTNKNDLVNAISEVDANADAKQPKRVELFTGSTAISNITEASGNVTLSSAYTNYDYLEFVYTQGSRSRVSQLIAVDNGVVHYIQNVLLRSTTTKQTYGFKVQADTTTSLKVHEGLLETITYGSPANISSVASTAGTLTKVYGIKRSDV